MSGKCFELLAVGGEVKLRLPHELYPAYEIAVCCDGQKSSGAPWYDLWDPSMAIVYLKKKDYIDGSSSSWQSQHHQGMMRGYWHGIWGRKMWNTRWSRIVCKRLSPTSQLQKVARILVFWTVFLTGSARDRTHVLVDLFVKIRLPTVKKIVL